MAELVFSAIQAGDIDMRPELYKHIGNKLLVIPQPAAELGLEQLGSFQLLRDPDFSYFSYFFLFFLIFLIFLIAKEAAT